MASSEQTYCLMCDQPLEQPATGRRRQFSSQGCRDLYRMIKGLDVGTKTEGSEMERRYDTMLTDQGNEVYKEKARRRVRRFLRQFIEDTKVSEGAL